MASVRNSVETVNAAAAAIVTAESRVQPVTDQKRRWGSCWSLYWCFGSLKTNKRISHAALVPEPTVTESAAVPSTDNPNPSTSIVLPFNAPPSSPLQSDPPTAINSPGGVLTLTSLSINSFSSAGQAHIFTIGPYAHETQLVSPPVFSAFTTEPSTAAVTPPPEPFHSTTPSSPEVPFAQLLTSSLNRARRNSTGTNQRLAVSCYGVHHLISPGSANSTSGTSSPYYDRRPVLEFRMVDASKLFDSKKFSTRKWGSRLGSGSMTPDGVGLASYDSLPLENQISEVASLVNSEIGSPIAEEAWVDHRVSFELSHEDAQTLLEKKEMETLDQRDLKDRSTRGNNVISLEVENRCKLCAEEEGLTEIPEMNSGEIMKDCQHKRSSVSLGSVKEFNFDSSEAKSSSLSSEWWADEKDGKDIGAANNWTFFPLLQPGVS